MRPAVAFCYLFFPIWLFPIACKAWQLGPVAVDSRSSESLNINGRYVKLKSGGAGVWVEHQLLEDHLSLDGAALFGYKGSVAASFAGADVNGPATLSTLRANASVFWDVRPKSSPYLRLGYGRQRGDTNFDGVRGSTPVTGRATLAYSTTELALGYRLTINQTAYLFAELGRYAWSVNSDASGTLGALRAKTTIEGSHQDSFARLGFLAPINTNWKVLVGVGEYRMTAENQIKSLTIEGNLRYGF